MLIDDGPALTAQHPSWSGQLQGRDAGDPARLDPLELESLALNMDRSLGTRARHQFFSWTQGALQGLIEHQVLICALRENGRAFVHVDAFSTISVDPGHISEQFRQDAFLVPHLIKAWEDNQCRVVCCEAGSGDAFAGSVLARELTRWGASQIVAHGTHDASGELASFFTFACRPGTADPRRAYYVELLVPFLHAAWIRTQVDWQARGVGAKPAVASLLTSREREILEWIYRGKSNIEIGMILKISSLTVKNHVQKILRKLDVLNRTQAVGKALALRILNT